MRMMKVLLKFKVYTIFSVSLVCLLIMSVLDY